MNRNLYKYKVFVQQLLIDVTVFVFVGSLFYVGLKLGLSSKPANNIFVIGIAAIVIMIILYSLFLWLTSRWENAEDLTNKKFGEQK